MTLHRMLFVCLFALAGCLQPADTVSVSSADESLSSGVSTVSDRDEIIRPRPCEAVVCNANGTCPVCNGQSVQCDADNACHYPPPPPSPPAPPACPAAVCNLDIECAAVCEHAPSPHCVGHVCHYTIGDEDS